MQTVEPENRIEGDLQRRHFQNLEQVRRRGTRMGRERALDKAKKWRRPAWPWEMEGSESPAVVLDLYLSRYRINNENTRKGLKMP